LNATPFQIVGFAKDHGVLSKRISLRDGKVVSDGSACVMSSGRAGRVVLNDLGSFATLIGSLQPHQAVALGRLNPELPDRVSVVTKRRLSELNGEASADTIARIGEHISYVAGEPALALIDIDTKGMPEEVDQRITAAGGFWPALIGVLPDLATTARVIRPSTSTGIYDTVTGERHPGSNGQHIFLLARDGTDVERFLRTFHDRCWLAGLGWYLVGAAGQLLERAVCDRSVYAPERLVFEGPPVMVPPLAQDVSQRVPVVIQGDILDTRTACPPLTILEHAKLKDLRARAAVRLAPDSGRAKAAFVNVQASKIATRTGIPLEHAKRIVERQATGILLPDVVLEFDDQENAGATVGDILADPLRFEGATLADPLEGIAYGLCKAKVLLRSDGTPWIHSFAHGRTIYELRYNAKAIADAIAKAADEDVAAVYARMAARADLGKAEAEALRNAAAQRSGIGKRTLDAQVKQEQQERAEQQKQEDSNRRTAERLDTRPQIPAPLPDAPWLPQMQVLNDVLGEAQADEPPMRDIDGAMTEVRVRRVPNMHVLTPGCANDCESVDDRMPAPEQPLLTRLDDVRVAELIERYIDYVGEDGRSVHLAVPFVKHYVTRGDEALPVVSAIATLPVVLKDGALLSARGLDRQRGIVFRVPSQLLVRLPNASECPESAVAGAMRFLTDEWLCDVATDYIGKCTLIAAALTIVERSMLPERPVFFVTAGRRGGGKTTVLNMLLVATTGVRPAAAAWSPDAEERRKALLSYLMAAMPAIIWDNIPRGTQISCPHLEKACTSADYSDRRLGVSEMVSVSAGAIHMFTGNNVGPKGDLASRSLQIRLEVDRPDPENREFVHLDPIGWTEANRAKILRALYVLMLGNPNLRADTMVTPQTRFKDWWCLVGSAVENAAKQAVKQHVERVAALVEDANALGAPEALNFRDLFLSQEEDEEDTASIAEALAALAFEWPDGNTFTAGDLAKKLNDQSVMRIDAQRERQATLREFLFADLPHDRTITTKSASKRLRKHVGDPVRVAKSILCLRSANDSHSEILGFRVVASRVTV
jgi:hypothetical protein